MAGIESTWREIQREPSALVKQLLRLGPAKGALGLTLLSVALSWLITAAVLSFADASRGAALTFILVTLCTAAVAAPVGYSVLHLLERLNGTREIARRLAQHDPLTGVLNRAFFFQRTRQLLDSLPQGRSLAILIMDLDFFKQINDQLGHIEGDRVLVRICQCISGQLQRDEFTGRFGGDEFVICLQGTNADGLKQRAQKLCDACYAMLQSQYPDSRIPLSVSIGGSLFRGGSKGRLQQLLHDADYHLYQVKQSGKGRAMVA